MQGKLYIVTCMSDSQELYYKEHIALSEEDAINMGKDDYVVPDAEVEKAQWTAEKM